MGSSFSHLKMFFKKIVLYIPCFSSCCNNNDNHIEIHIEKKHHKKHLKEIHNFNYQSLKNNK
jgi:hypothetical protein